MTKLSSEAYAIVEGRHADPFHYLGLHTEGDRTVVRAFLPDASKVEAIGEHGDVASLSRIHDAGLFAGALPNGALRYQLRAQYGDNVVSFDDPYRFPPVLSDYDLYLLGEGSDQQLYDKIGAHPLVLDGVDGVAFVVFAPNARRVSVVGDFNFWDARRHPMRRRGVGYWELFIPRVRAGGHYKFDVIGPHGQHLPLKSDPLAFYAEVRPKTASIVFDEASLPRPNPAPQGINARSAPMSIYEVHLGSWRRGGNNEWLSYRDLAEQLPAYARDMGFTHVEFLPVREHPFDVIHIHEPLQPALSYWSVWLTRRVPHVATFHAFMEEEGASEDLLAELASREPFGRAAEPWEVANVIVFLASDYAAYMTGEVVSVSSQHP